MTVVDPIPPGGSWNSLPELPDDVSDLPDNVHLLDRRRIGAAALSVTDDATAPEVLDVDQATGLTAAPEPVRAPFLSRIRAWMVVPPVDFVMLVAPVVWHPQVSALLARAALGTLLLSGGVRYRAPLHLSVLDELPTILTRLLVAAAPVAAIFFVMHQRMALITFLQAACVGAALVVVGRFITTRLIGFARRRAIATYRTVLIGGGPLAAELARILNDYPVYGLKVDGFVDDGSEFPAEEFLPRLGTLADLDIAVAATRASTLLVADGNFEERALTDVLRTEQCQAADLLVVPRLHHFHTLTGQADHIGSIPIMRIRNPNLRGPARLIKRAFDIAVAVIALILLLPLLILAAVAMRLEGGPGVIFRQVRVGRDGKHFELLKFRTMRPVDEVESETLWSVATDSRVGPVGRFLRCTSIDELPQLWNILRGDMTLVGPRPERPHFVEQFSMQFDGYARRHRVQAGLTGFAQVSGLRGDTSIADRARYDNFYIENWSLWLDIKIILRTFREVLFYRGR
jgi:exopolysaccharide biosynthesis polyprenyl glycosylphosphotransferase